MKRRAFLWLLVAFFVFLVSACEELEGTTLTSITFDGVDDVVLEFEEEFNVYDGVTAIGNDGQDYTDEITFLSTSDISEEGVLNTAVTGEHAVRYEIRIEDIVAQHWRYITVEQPERPEGEFLLNGDFTQGSTGWDDAENGLYVADGAALTLTTEDGVLVAEVIAGSNVFTPRFGQQNVPFEQGVTYEISFDAKASVEKTINLQVGELIDGPPYFNDFKTNITVHRLITTEWATYSYKFTMNEDNQNGGPLFEMGTIDGESIDATIWFDNIVVTETEPDEDLEGPVITGLVESLNINVGSTFDPLAGVTAFDVTDGDVTDAIAVTIEDSEGLVVDAVDTSVDGVFTLTYFVEDSLGNETEEVVTVNVVSLLFKDQNLVVNGDFATPLDPETPVWGLWSQDWGAAPVVVADHDDEAGTLALDITGGGDAAWAVQLFQEGITLEQGVTYRVQFTGHSTVERSINVALGYGEPWVEYARQDEMTIGTESATYEVIFTVTKPTYDVKLVFELGNTANFEDSVVTFEHVEINPLDVEPIIPNGDFGLVGWRAFFNDWEGTVGNGSIVDGEFVVTINTYNYTGANWTLQLIQDGVSMGGSEENGLLELLPDTTYTLSFDAYASQDVTIRPLVATVGAWVNFIAAEDEFVTLSAVKTTYTLSFTTPAELPGNEIVKFEFGDAFESFTEEEHFVVFDNIEIKDSEEARIDSVFNGDFETVLYHTYDNSGGGEGSMVRDENGALVTVTAMGQAYQPHVYYMIDSLDPGQYQLVLRLTARVARDLRMNLILPDAGWISILPDTKYDFSVNADEEMMFVVDFTIEDTVTNLKFELDFGDLGEGFVSETGEFVLHEILLYPVLS